MSETSGGEVLARMLQAEGVEKVFGIIDGTYFGFYSSLHKLGIEIVTPRHETCAAHMAGAYARLTGKLGVCMASNGPGVANLLPGTGRRECRGQSRARHHQLPAAADRLPRPRRHVPGVRPGRRHPEVLQVEPLGGLVRARGGTWAHGAASLLGGQAGRGPPRRAGDDHQWQGEGRRRNLAAVAVPPHTCGHCRAPDQVAQAAELLAVAELPIIHAGSGVIHAASLRRAATRREMRCMRRSRRAGPAAACCQRRHELAMPMAFIKLNNEVRNDADVVLVLGSRLGETDWWGKAPNWRHPSEQRDDPGRHRRAHPRREQARDARGARGRQAVPGGAGD
jgi:acetolactate synthase I/II/III large subunit